MSVKAVLFDKDGVLVDFQATWGKASHSVILDLAEGDEDKAKELAKAADFDLDSCTFDPKAAFIAGSGEELLAAWTPILGDRIARLGEPPIFQLFTKWGHHHVTGAPALKETLGRLRGAGLPLGVATNDSEESAKLQMSALDVSDHFNIIMGANSGHGPKPTPGMLLHFAERHDIAPSEMIMIGDTFHDLRAGKAAGAIRVAIGTGPIALEALRPEADFAIERLDELPALVEQIG